MIFKSNLLDIVVFNLPKRNIWPYIILVGIIILILIAIHFICKKIAAIYNKKEKTNRKTVSYSSEEDICEICGNYAKEGYKICDTCFELMQSGELSKCKNCGRWYKNGEICQCMKTNK